MKAELTLGSLDHITSRDHCSGNGRQSVILARPTHEVGGLDIRGDEDLQARWGTTELTV